MPEGLSEEKSRQISNFFEQALQNYEDILDDRPEAEVDATDKRIQSNVELSQKHGEQLQQSQEQQRNSRLYYLRRYSALKAAFENGKIDKKTYYQELEKLDQEYKFKNQSLADDVSFHKTQQQQASEKLKRLEERNRLNRMQLSQQQKASYKARRDNKPKIELEKLRSHIEKLGCFVPRRMWASTEIK